MNCDDPLVTGDQLYAFRFIEVVTRNVQIAISFFLESAKAIEAEFGSRNLLSDRSGLRLDSAALIEGRMQQVLDVLQRGLKHGEHDAFIGRLQNAATE